MAEAVRLAQLTIDLADGDANKGNFFFGSPLVGAIMLRGCARCCLGDKRWRADIDNATTMVRAFDPTLRAIALLYKYGLTLSNGVSLPDDAAAAETVELLEVAERSGDDFTLACARYVRGLTLVEQDGDQRADRLSPSCRSPRSRVSRSASPWWRSWMTDTYLAEEQARTGDLDGAIELLRPTFEEHLASGDQVFGARVTAVFVDTLLRRGDDADVQEAQAAIDRLAAVPTEPGFVLHQLTLLRLRALMARAHGDRGSYRDFRDRYRAMATSLGFEGHMKWAEAMP